MNHWLGLMLLCTASIHLNLQAAEAIAEPAAERAVQSQSIKRHLSEKFTEELITTARYENGEPIPYLLNFTRLPPKYLLILFPGGTGLVDPRLNEEGKLVYGFKGNFLLRARPYWVDQEFATVTTNSTESSERIQGLLNDLQQRFPLAQIYLIGTSRGTMGTVRLAEYLQDKIAGVIHTSSMANAILYFDTRKLRNRQLIVHHKKDACHVTGVNAAIRNQDRYGTDLILMEGGFSEGDACEAFSHHGYRGIESETVDAIKAWIRKGRVGQEK